MLNKTDEQLMLIIKDGNESAFGILVNRYLPKLLPYADNIVGDSADDIIQETFINIWKNAYKFDEQKASFKTWLYTILNNNCYNYLKKSKVIKTDSIENIEDIVISKQTSAEEALLINQKHKDLKQSISNLKPREQQVILLRYFEELSNKETATIMNSSTKGVEALLARARKKLKDYFNKTQERC